MNVEHSIYDDPEMMQLVELEFERHSKTINLIASENYTYRDVLRACGSILMTKYAEGLPGNRYYGGVEVVDCIERLCQKRALDAFALDSSQWGANVQAYSGSIANFIVYSATLEPGSTILGMDLPSGGHLTHGYRTEKKRISATSVYFDTVSYKIGVDGRIDYDEVYKICVERKPKMIVCGYSAYSRDLDYEKFRKAADMCGAYLVADISHISGIIAAKKMKNPFEYVDIVTTTTHKSIRGPRGAIIFYKKLIKIGDESVDLESKINFSVFPKVQGGPHCNNIAGIAVALLNMSKPWFLEYIGDVCENSKIFCEYLIRNGYEIPTGGTDNHMFLVDLRNKGVDGRLVEEICEKAGLVLNKNAIFGDTKPKSPSGVRIGTCAISARGLKGKDVLEVAKFFDICVKIAVRIKSGEDCKSEIQHIRTLVEEFISKFPINM